MSMRNLLFLLMALEVGYSPECCGRVKLQKVKSTFQSNTVASCSRPANQSFRHTSDPLIATPIIAGHMPPLRHVPQRRRNAAVTSLGFYFESTVYHHKVTAT